MQWGLVAFLEFPLNLTTELLSLAISGLFLLAVFTLGPQKIDILKLIFYHSYCSPVFRSAFQPHACVWF